MNTPANILYKHFCLTLIAWFFCTAASAATYYVGSLTDLNTRIGSAVAGDTIILSNGVYSSASSINISKVGTAANPITIEAQTLLGVELTGAKGFSLVSPAAYITIQGFKFTHAGSIGISSGTSHCRLTRNVIELTIPATNDTSYINISGDDVQIDHNELRNKSTLGEMLDIAGSGSQVARRLWVHHNYFHDFSSPGGNGAETIRWGLSGLSLSTGDGLCEYNLFVHCEGENEMISNKSSGNAYRYNSVLDCIGGEISQRHGNDCYYYGNYVRNSQGIRVYGDRHRIFSNYFESNSVGVNMGNGDGDVYAGAPLTSHDRPDNNIVVYNTFVGNGTHYEMTGRTGGLGSSNTIVANNIFMNGGSMASISTSAPYTGTYTNNIRWNTSSAGSMPASAYQTINPLLVRDARGIYHLPAGSPAIDAGRGAYDFYGNFSTLSFVTNDLDGQLRDAFKDIGADEFSAAPVIAFLLTTNDVGPFSGLTNAGSFSLAVSPGSQSVVPGNAATYTVSVIFSGFTNAVTLGVSGLPPNTSSNFSPVSVTNTANATLSIITSSNTPLGNYTLTVTGNGGSSTNTAVVTLLVSTNTAAQPGVLLWTGGGANINWSTSLDWTNLTSGGTGTPGISNDVFFANNGIVPGTNSITSIVDSGLTIQSLTFTNNGGFHTVQINPGCTLAIVGTNGYQNSPALDVGMDIHPPSPLNVRAGVSGIGGTLLVSNLNACVQVRQGFGSGTVGTTATLDLSGLGTFVADLRRFQLGSESGTPRRVAGVVYLARTNVITLNQALDVNATNWSSGTPALVLGHNTATGNTNGSQLFLGIENTINVNQIVAGRGNQTNNLIAFNPAFLGNSPSVTFRGSDGISRVGQWTIGDNSAGSIAGAPSSGTNDFSGGLVDALVDRLLLGRGRNGNTVDTGIGVLTFDGGVIDANLVRLGTMIDEGTSTNGSGVGVMNVNGAATLVVHGLLELAHTNTTAVSAPAAVAGTRGVLNLNGGTVQATNIAGAGGTAIINFNSGLMDLQPDWAAAPGVIANISTLNVGTMGTGAPALLTGAAQISTTNTLTIASNGTVAGNTIISAPLLVINGAISPGVNGTGAITNNGPATLGAGGRYVMTVADAAAGPAAGWSFLQTGGGLDVESSAASPFVIQLQSFDPGDTGLVTNFNPSASYAWTIATAVGGITHFSADKFVVDASRFQNDLAGGSFSVQTNGNSLQLLFTSLPTAPLISGITLIGQDLVINGSGGSPGGNYSVLVSTNLALPVSQWQRVATNVFDGGGNFQFTNTVNTAAGQQYFMISPGP